MTEKNPKNKKQKPHNRWLILTGAGLQMGVVIFVCAYIGKKLDENYNNETSWFTLVFVLFGIFSSMYLLLKQIKRLDK